MQPERWRQVEQIFHSALKVEEGQRSAFLDQACGGDKELRLKLESLLAHNNEADSFLESSALEVAAQALSQDARFSGGLRGRIISHYRIIEKVGGGGMGVVYEAEDLKLGRHVALKFLSEPLAGDCDALERFHREARAASTLDHPNISTIFEIGEHAGLPFIAMQFLKGQTLARRLAASPLPVDQVVELGIQIADALEAAHKAGIIHRDIKPANVFITDQGQAKILDFGIAKLTRDLRTGVSGSRGKLPTTLDAVFTSPGAQVGTFAYMSPEQERGQDLDSRSDLFSFGLVLYDMATGWNTFSDKVASVVHNAVGSTTIQRNAPKLPPGLGAVIEKATQVDPNLRYQTAAEMRADLECLKRDELPPSSRLSNQSDSVPTNNLSPQNCPLVGRDREINEICSELRSNFVRLLTLTGVGGTGKTTLGLAAGRRLLPNFADGVFFIDLSCIEQAELVPSAVAQPLGVREGDGKPMLQTLKDHLRRKQTLLILDNFEQVLPAGFIVTELFAAAPGLKILVTSRSRLQLTLEHEYVVPPLATPSAIKEHSPNDLMRYGAVKLFVDRARSAMGTFTLTPENVRSVAEICMRLDGLPLGIELAAARMKVLSPSAILARLDHRLKLLTGGPRDLPSRQQTMTSAMDWSYELLKDKERCLFQRLAVFAGGFTMESAEEVAGGPIPASEQEKERASASRNEVLDVLDSLTRLVNQSLVVAEERGHGDMRFRMLGIVREYALERLALSGEMEAIRQKHAAHFLALAEAAEPELQSTRPGLWLNRLEEEYDNIREALRWSIVSEPGTAARMGAAIRYFWDYMGYLTEGLGILKEILGRSDQIPPLLRCKLFSMAGNIAKFQRDDKIARQMYERGLNEARSLGNLSQVSAQCRGLGGLAVEQGDHVTARRLIDEALATARESDDQFGIARSLNMLGDLARVEGDNSAARMLLKEALEVCRQTGRKYPTAIILNNLAAAEFGDGDFEAAATHFSEGLTMAQEPDGRIAGNKIAISYALDGFAALALHSGSTQLAATLAGSAEHLRQSMSFRIESAERRFREVYIALIRAALPENQFDAAYEQGSKLGLAGSIALALGKDIPEAS